MKTKILLTIFAIAILLNTVSAETFKYEIGTLFQSSDGTIYIVSGYQGTTYELTSTTSTVYVDRTVVDTWSPLVLESSLEKAIRKLKEAAVIGGVIKPEFYGDVNGDNQFTKADAVLTTAVYGGTGTFNAYQTIAADINGDGLFNKTDAVMMVVYYFNTADAVSTRIGVPIPNALSTTSPIPIPVITGVVSTSTSTPIVTTTPPPPQTTTSPSAVVTYYSSTFSSNGINADQLNIPQNSDVTVYITLTSNDYARGTLKTEVRRDISFGSSGWVDNDLTTFTTDTTLQPNKNTILAGTFKATDQTGVSNFVHYYLKVSWNNQVIYDPESREGRGKVTTYLLTTQQQNQPQYYQITSTATPTPVVTQPVVTSTTPQATATASTTSLPPTTPGFESVFAITGLLTVAWLVLRQRR